MTDKNKIADRAAGVSPSLTLAITAKAKEMQEKGIKVIGFGAGEPDFNTPDYISLAAKKAIDAGKTRYTASAGILPLRQAICDKLLRDQGLTYQPNQIVVSNGAKHSLFNVIQTLINPGDEVIIPAPYWLTYPELVKLCGGIPVIIQGQEKNEYKITPDQLKAAVTSKTKAVFINSPSNPTGAVYSETELQALAKIIEDEGIWVISDEIYEKLVYDGAKHYSIAQASEKLYQKTILVNGMSKVYAMTGWRIGYTASTKVLASAMDNIQSHTTSNPNTIAQFASLEALSVKEGEEFIQKMNQTFNARRKTMIARLKEMPYITINEPKGAFYVMMNVSKIFGKTVHNKVMNSAQDVAEAMLTHAQIAVVPGEAFGADQCIRLSYTLSEADMKTGLDRLEQFLKDI